MLPSFLMKVLSRCLNLSKTGIFYVIHRGTYSIRRSRLAHGTGGGVVASGGELQACGKGLGIPCQFYSPGSISTVENCRVVNKRKTNSIPSAAACRVCSLARLVQRRGTCLPGPSIRFATEVQFISTSYRGFLI